MKSIKFYEIRDPEGVVEVPDPLISTGDIFAPVYVECAWCPVLVPWNPESSITPGAERNSKVRRRWVPHAEGGRFRRPLCLDCTDDADQMEYDAQCAEAERRAAQEADDMMRWGR